MAFSLESLRTHHKRIIWVLIGLIVPTMCFFGLGTALSSWFGEDVNKSIGKVEGKNLSYEEYMNLRIASAPFGSDFRTSYYYGYSSYDLDYTLFLMIGYNISSPSSDNVLMLEALYNKAVEKGFKVSFNEAKAFVQLATISDLRGNEANKFSEFLARQVQGYSNYKLKITEESVINAIAKILSVGKFSKALSGSFIASRYEIDKQYLEDNEKMKIAYFKVAIEDIFEKIKSEYDNDKLNDEKLAEDEKTQLEAELKMKNEELDKEIQEYFDKAKKEFEDEVAGKTDKDEDDKDKPKYPYLVEDDKDKKKEEEKEEEKDEDKFKDLGKDEPKVYSAEALKLEYLMVPYKPEKFQGVSLDMVYAEYARNKFNYIKDDLEDSGPYFEDVIVANVNEGAMLPEEKSETKVKITEVKDAPKTFAEYVEILDKDVAKVELNKDEYYYKDFEIVSDDIYEKEYEKQRDLIKKETENAIKKVIDYYQEELAFGASTDLASDKVKFEKKYNVETAHGFIESFSADNLDEKFPNVGKVELTKEKLDEKISKWKLYSKNVQGTDLVQSEIRWGTVDCDMGKLYLKVANYIPSKVVELEKVKEENRDYDQYKKSYLEAKEKATKMVGEIQEKGHEKFEMIIRGTEKQDEDEPVPEEDLYFTKSDKLARYCFEEELDVNDVGDPYKLDSAFVVPVVLEKKAADINEMNEMEATQKRRLLNAKHRSDAIKQWCKDFFANIKHEVFEEKKK